MSLTIKNLCKSFGEKQILIDFSYLFSDSGIYIIKGDSGIGKTTLLRIISGIDKKYTGSVIGGGIGNVSFCFQEYRLFPQLTALQNITDVVWEKADESNVFSAREMLLKLGFCENEFNLLPNQLSGGMKQRVSLARAFLKKSPILLLDEPTKELDKALCKIVRDIIQQESKHRLVIMVTHSNEDILEMDAKIIHLGAV